MHRVLLFHNVVAPYRHALFAELAKQQELMIWFSTRMTRDRAWNGEIPNSYPHEVLRSRVLYAFGRPLIWCSSVLKQLKEYRPALVIAVLTRSNAIDVLRIGLFVKKIGIPFVLWVGATEGASPNDGVPHIINAIFENYYRTALRLASGFLYYSVRSKDWAEARGANGPFVVGTQVLEGQQLPGRVSIGFESQDSPVIKCLYVGKLDHRKGFDVLLDAISTLPQSAKQRCVFTVIGDGELRAALNSTQMEGVRITWKGQVQREQIWREYIDSDFLVLPSRHDPWGFVVNEAMAMGTPVVCSDACGAVELAERAGWVVTSGSVTSLVQGLVKAIVECRSVERRETAIQAEQEYRPEKCACSISNLIKGLAR